MTKPRDIVRRIGREARRCGPEFRLDHEGANHTVYRLDGVMIPIPRHREIGERLTEQIYRECQGKLGEGVVASMTTYTAHATRDGGFWLVHVPGVERYTQARSVDEIETMARDLVAVMTGQDPADIGVDVTVELPESVRRKLDRVERARATELRARAEAAAELRSAALELKRTGMSVRELGRVLHVSYQRAGQLTAGSG